MFQHSWNTDRLAFFVDHRISCGCAIQRLYPAVFSNVEGNGICSSHRFSVEVYIVSNQKFARPNYSRARVSIKLVRPEIWLPVCLFYFVEKTFVFALPDDSEVCTFRIFRCFLIEIYGDLQFIAAAFWIPRNALSTAASGLPTKVTTVRLVVAPGSTSSNDTPSTDAIASVICRIMSGSRPSEKLGTHSISFCMAMEVSNRIYAISGIARTEQRPLRQRIS